MFRALQAFEPAKRGREALESLCRAIVANGGTSAPCNGPGEY